MYINMLKEHAAAIFRIEVSGVRLQSDYKADYLESIEPSSGQQEIQEHKVSPYYGLE
jgi:hypothetical protein